MNDYENMTAGELLRQARTTGRRKRELDTVARQLCIKKDFLAALENDDFGKIPELVYILGFARNYAMELELDPYIIVDKIKKQLGLMEEEDAIEIEGEDRPDLSGKKERKSMKVPFNPRKLVLGLLILAGLAAVGGGAWYFVSRAGKAEEAAEIIGKYNLPVGTEYGVRNRDYAAVVLQATGDTWVQVRNTEGAVLFEHSLLAGDVYYALTGTIATIGNAGAIDVWLNGRQAQSLGREYQRVEVMLNPDTLGAR